MGKAAEERKRINAELKRLQEQDPDNNYFYDPRKKQIFHADKENPRNKIYLGENESKKPETAAGATTKIKKEKKLGSAAGATTKIKKEKKQKKKPEELNYEINVADATTKIKKEKKQKKKPKITGGKVYKKPGVIHTDEWSTKQREKAIDKNAGKNNRKAKIKDKIEKVTPTTDKTNVSPKDRSTKLRERTINKNTSKNNREAGNKAKIGAGGETVSETVSEPVSGASTNRRTRDKNANKKTTSEATAIDGDKTVGKKGSGTGAPVNNEHVRAYKKHRTNTEFRRRDNELSKEEEQSFKEPDSAETKKTKDKSKKKYFKRVMSFLGKKGEGVNAREVYRRQRKRGGSTKNLLTTDRKENYTMTGGRGKGLDVDSANKSYNSRYKKKGSGTGASGNKKISLNDAHVQAWKKSGDHDAHVQAWKKSKDHDAHVQAWKRSKTGQSGNNSASGGNKSDWNTTKFTDPQLKTRNKRLFNTLKSRGR